MPVLEHCHDRERGVEKRLIVDFGGKTRYAIATDCIIRQTGFNLVMVD